MIKKYLILFFSVVACLSAKAQPTEFNRYYQSFKKQGDKIYISQEWLETSPHKILKPMKNNDVLHWVIRPILNFLDKRQSFGNQSLNQCIRGRSISENMDLLNKKAVTYYQYGSYQLSEKYRSLIYFFVDEKMWQDGIEEVYCFLINYSPQGKLMGGLLLGRTSKYTGYQVDVTRQLPKKRLLVRNIGYMWGKQGKPGEKEYDHDYYYQIDAQGQIKDIQRKYYPYNGKFVDVGGNYIEVEQCKDWLFCTYWDKQNPKSSRGTGSSRLNPQEHPFIMKINAHKYKSEFAGSNTLVLNLPNGKIWVFKRKK